MSLHDYRRYAKGRLKPIDPRSETVREDIKFNNKLKKELETEFKSHPTVYESYVFQDGYVTIPKGVLKEGQESEFERRVLGVNHYLHGIYNTEDAGAIQKRALGKLASQFRKWMRPGWNKRFGAKFWKGYWNERRKVYEEGHYVTSSKFLFSPIIGAVQFYRVTENATAAMAINKLMRDMSHYYRNLGIYWHAMDDAERANVMRSAGEVAFFATTMMIGHLLLALREGVDEDEEFQKFLIGAFMYQQDRTMVELLTYSPGYGWFNEGKKLFASPAASFSTVSGAYKLFYYSMMYPFQDDEERIFRGGPYRGELKVKVEAQKLTPYSSIKRLLNVDDHNRYYKLFGF